MYQMVFQHRPSPGMGLSRDGTWSHSQVSMPWHTSEIIIILIVAALITFDLGARRLPV